MPLRTKYSIDQWVLNRDHLNPGDIISYFNDFEQKEINSKVIGFPSPERRDQILCERLDNLQVEIISFYQTIVYKIQDGVNQSSYSKPICSCGAKFTTNPSFHLSYCDMTSR